MFTKTTYMNMFDSAVILVISGPLLSVQLVNVHWGVQFSFHLKLLLLNPVFKYIFLLKCRCLI